ncbi:MAG: hypothetical protein IT377_09490 [Polyangiaceae bacterium]|nr:hypothetical protein [Polyangiaceae bacterium]
MRPLFTLVIALSSAFAACSSESTNTGSAGSGGSTGGGAGTGGATGGTSAGGGSGGGAGTAGQGGTAAGDAGLGGSDSGGSDSGGGSDGGGTGGSAGLPAKVACGSAAPGCPTNPGRCCYESGKDKPVCQLEAAPCDPWVNTRILCDGSQDCATGEICCHAKSLIGFTDGGSYQPTVGCAKTCESNTSAVRFQVCDLKQTSPTQCLTGTCKKVVHVNPPQTTEAYVPSLPIGYGVCKS